MERNQDFSMLHNTKARSTPKPMEQTKIKASKPEDDEEEFTGTPKSESQPFDEVLFSNLLTFFFILGFIAFIFYLPEICGYMFTSHLGS